MQETTKDFEQFKQIDQELQELKGRFSRADVVLRQLEDIQIQFEGLADTHQRMTDTHKELSQIKNQSEEIIENIKITQVDSEKKLKDLREKSHLQLNEINSKISELKEKQNNYRDSLNQIESRISIIETHDSTIQSLQLDINEIQKNLAIKQQELHQIIKLEVDSLRQESQPFYREIGFIKKSYNQFISQSRVMKNSIVFLFILDLIIIVWIWQR